jgi:hypothetical protein
MIGFLIPPHLGDGFPRYFCPALISFLIFVLSCLEKREFPLRNIVLILFFLYLGTGYNLYHLYRVFYAKVSIASIPGLFLPDRQALFEKQYQEYLQKRKPIKADSAVAYYFPDMDFQNNS